MTINKLVRLGASALVGVICLGGLFAGLTINTIRMGGPIQIKSQQASDLVADILPPPEYIIEAYLETTLLKQHPGDRLHVERLAGLRKDFETRHAYWQASDIEPGIGTALTATSYRPAAAFWQEIDRSFLPAVKAGDTAKIDASYARLTAAYAAHRAAIDKLVIDTTAYQQKLTAEGSRQVGIAILLLAGLGLVVVGLAIAASYLILKKLVAPVSDLAVATTCLAEGGDVAVPFQARTDELGGIAKAVELFRIAAVERAAADARTAREQERVVEALVVALELLASGDLTAKIAVEFPPNFARAKANFEGATQNLRKMIQAVVENADKIRTGTSEIAQASDDLARRTESNAASLEETSAALVQIDDRLKATTIASVDTVRRADQAIATVRGGRGTAEEAVQAMGRVSGSAKGIDSVIEGLDKIAFQTRVLAMNAAVEAGRAGDAGRGFAVVADLVSALAMRAEEEAKRARDQLTVTQSEIVTAVTAVEKVDVALAAITGDVDEVHKLLAVMASDNLAQSQAVTEITAAISSMDRSTQQNAAMVEETSAATRTLTAEVGELAESARAFKFERREVNIAVAVERRARGAAPAARPKAPMPAARRPVARIAGPRANGRATAAAADWSDF